MGGVYRGLAENDAAAILVFVLRKGLKTSTPAAINVSTAIYLDGSPATITPGDGVTNGGSGVLTCIATVTGVWGGK